MKKLIYIFMAMVSATAYGQSFSGYAQDFTVNGIYYQILDDRYNSVVVTGNYKDYTTTNDYSGKIVVPEAVTYKSTSYKVVGIGPYTFYKSPNITSVDMSACHYLEFIGEHAFDGECKSWYWYQDEGEARWDAPLGNSSLTTIKWPSYYNTQTKVSIGKCAFANCKNLTSMTIDNNIGSIGTDAFRNTTGTLTCTMDVIPSYAFMYNAFSSAYVNSATVGSSAFYRSSNLKQVTFGTKFRQYYTSAFNMCSVLEKFIIDYDNTSFKSLDDCIYAKTGYKLYLCPATKKVVDVDKNVTEVSDNAFSLNTPTAVILHSSTPPTFSGEFGGKTYLFIPRGSRYTYGTHEYWGKAYGAYELAETPYEDVNADGKVNATDAMQIYNYILSH